MNSDQLDYFIEGSSKIMQELLQIHDLDILLEHLLTEVRLASGANAGSVYLVEGNSLKFSCAQNDELQKKLPFGKKLIYSTFSIGINNESIAGYVAVTGIAVNISDAYNIDVTQPYSFDKSFDEITGYRTRSVLAVPIKTFTGKIIGVIQLINSVGADKTIRQFSPIAEKIAQIFADNSAIAIDHAQITRAAIMRVNRLLEFHGLKESGQHNNRVAASSVEIYENWAYKKGVPEREIKHACDILRMAAMLHDIGKGAIPSYILEKNQNELTPQEKKIFQTYPIYGATFFQNISSNFEEMAREIALNHQERWDGEGFPGHVNFENGKPMSGYEKSDGTAFGKSGNEIPIFARIVAVADAYDLLLPHHFSEEKNKKEQIEIAINKILSCSGSRFDPEVVVSMLDCIDAINSVVERYPDKNSSDLIHLCKKDE
jgi:HD-GYP domain-containing protein (c-di-GMP phosphodiesterase class II)